MEDIKLLKTIEEIRGLSDPYRYRILSCFYKLEKPSTVKQIADEMGEVPANVHYHVKKMEKVGILILVHTKEINGIIAKYYEPTAKNFRIVREDGEDISNSAKLSETHKVISGLYDESRKTFLENSLEIEEEKVVGKGFMSMENIYLTEAEVEGFTKYIQDYLDNNAVSGKSKSADVVEYHCFVSMVKINKKK